MDHTGRIAVWYDDKGYGFIRSPDIDDRVFVHIKAFSGRQRPVTGDRVRFTLSRDTSGRVRAENARLAGARAIPLAYMARTWRTPALGIGFLLLLAGAALISVIPTSVAVLYLALSSVTFISYALDKSAARRGTRRTPENSLHLLALAGGWPGALVARHSLRHKTRKQPFRAILWITVAVNCAALVWLLTLPGSATLDRLLSQLG
ncbi:MAG: cold shock and DUF1294 domain-containing protein [Gammaproteobacteria bacterium]|nr:cold shock and DUF1294 domain-containing protein [Gammaproteobacteria bacterium]